MRAEEIRRLIEAGLPGATVMVQGDDGQHFDALVVSPEFEGKTMIKQHQMVYSTLGNRMGTGEIHALGLKTFTPREWSAAAH
jgi:acid stress-induced BolA-like protein IbaG/YrbA